MSQAGGRAERRSSLATLGTTVVAGLATSMALLLMSGVAHAEEPATTVPPVTDEATSDVPVGEVDGALVAVGQPPVPEYDVIVDVGVPPVPSFSVPDAITLALW